MNKISTSIQYQLTNVKFFDDIFLDFKTFHQDLGKGPDFMKERLCREWYELKEELKNHSNLIVKDMDKKVTKDDFNVTYNETEKGIPVFFFEFPDYEYNDAASKYVALVVSQKRLSFMTLEYSNNILTGERQYVIGEFYVDEKTDQVSHRNYGTIDNDRLSYFVGYILGMFDHLDE